MNAARPKHPLAPFLQPARLWIHARLDPLPENVREFVLFGLKMAWSCLFGAAMLGLIIGSSLVWPSLGWPSLGWPETAAIHRYDFLFVMAVGIQIIMLWTGLETREEMAVIFLYHLTGTVMEVFKTHVGSWSYPEAAWFRIGGVPLFTGFMYASVGSFIVRAIRVFDMRFSHYPDRWWTWCLAVAIYVNFFTHHYMVDIRNGIFVVGTLMFLRTFVHYRVGRRYLSMPFVVAGTLTALFLWVAENIGTVTRTWLYAGAGDGWRPVSLHKVGAWGMLLVISFVLVTLVVKLRAPDDAARQSWRAWAQDTWRRLVLRQA